MSRIPRTRHVVEKFVASDDIHAGYETFLRSMIGIPPREADYSELVEEGRMIGVKHGQQIIGVADSGSSWLVVPGGARISNAYVSHVGVLPTHTRRGVMSDLMLAQLSMFANEGAITATLTPSQSGIYGRFGYALASVAARVGVNRRHALLPLPLPPTSEVRLVTGGDRWSVMTNIHEQSSWVGATGRPKAFWNLEQQLDKTGNVFDFVASHSLSDELDGYVRYRPRNANSWFSGTERVIEVLDFVALNDTSFRALVAYLWQLELVDRVDFVSLPVDQLLTHLISDRDAVDIKIKDEQWLRIIDAEKALKAREYRCAEPVIVKLSDHQIKKNSANFLITPEGIRKVDGDPDVAISIDALSQVYLGGFGWWHLEASGRTEVYTDGAIQQLDALFATTRQPYSGSQF